MPEQPVEITWKRIAQFPDGRSFVTDNSILLDTSYVSGPFPTETLPPEKAEPFLTRATTLGFGLADLEFIQRAGYYRAPDGTIINHKYIIFLKHLDKIKELHFRGSGPEVPLVIMDGSKVIGSLVPMIQRKD